MCCVVCTQHSGTQCHALHRRPAPDLSRGGCARLRPVRPRIRGVRPPERPAPSVPSSTTCCKGRPMPRTCGDCTENRWATRGSVRWTSHGHRPCHPAGSHRVRRQRARRRARAVHARRPDDPARVLARRRARADHRPPLHLPETGLPGVAGVAVCRNPPVPRSFLAPTGPPRRHRSAPSRRLVSPRHAVTHRTPSRRRARCHTRGPSPVSPSADLARDSSAAVRSTIGRHTATARND